MNLNTPAIQLHLSPRQRSDAEDWCRVQVVADTRRFNANFEAYIQSADLENFANQLRILHHNPGVVATASLASAEPNIFLQLTMQRLGIIHGKYELQSEEEHCGSAKLSGTFEADQSFLPGLEASVRELILELRSENAA